MNEIRFEKVDDNKEQYMNLFLEVDPEKDIIRSYLDDGDMYMGIADGEVTK